LKNTKKLGSISVISPKLKVYIVRTKDLMFIVVRSTSRKGPAGVSKESMSLFISATRNMGMFVTLVRSITNSIALFLLNMCSNMPRIQSISVTASLTAIRNC